MTRRKSKPDATARIGLPESLTHGFARDLADRIASAQGTDIAIDASAVSHIGAQCAQVLIAARRSWGARGRGFDIVEASPSFVDGVRLLGLTDHLYG